MKKKRQPIIKKATFDRIISGGQSIGTLKDEEEGKKIMAWGVLPNETANITLTKNKSNYCEGIISEPAEKNLLEKSEHRIEPKDPNSYLSTSPWQIMDFKAEQFYKSALIEEAFEMQNIVLPYPIETWTNYNQYYYRNKIEYSFWYDKKTEKLDLAFFKRGTHHKVPIDETSLAMPEITKLSKLILHDLNNYKVDGRTLKTLLIRANQNGDTAWQLYLKDETLPNDALVDSLDHYPNGEIFFSNPKSPASVITKKLWRTTNFQELEDSIFDKNFSYKTEGFFQINLPVYEKVLTDIKTHITKNTPVLDLYSGVGTIGLSVADKNPLTLVEINPVAVEEMQQNIERLDLKQKATAILASSENAIDYIEHNQIVIVDPPRAGMHENVTRSLVDKKPEKIIYLSCNPVTQARDIAPLLTYYKIESHMGYNFFPRTPHIEHLVVLSRI